MTRVVHRHVDGFDERNYFLDLVLGLVSATQRVERIVARAAVEAPRSVDGEEHPFDLFALGVISFSRRVSAHASGAMAETRAAPAAESAPDERTGGLLL